VRQAQPQHKKRELYTRGSACPWHISESLSGHVLVLEKHKRHSSCCERHCKELCPHRGAREGPQKLSVSCADALTDQP